MPEQVISAKWIGIDPDLIGVVENPETGVL